MNAVNICELSAEAAYNSGMCLSFTVTTIHMRAKKLLCWWLWIKLTDYVVLFSGAEHASNALKSSMQAAQTKVEEMRKLEVAAQKSLAEMKAEEIQKMAEYTSSINLQDLEDVPEAYLREDWNSRQLQRNGFIRNNWI